MANIEEPTEKQKKEWAKWVASRPKVVRLIAEKFFPWKLYRMKSTGQRVEVYGFNENGTVSVLVTGKFNNVLFDRQVFGIQPEDLEECDLPGPDEVVGSAMTQDEVEENIDVVKTMVRPDLWQLDAEGKAVRKQ